MADARDGALAGTQVLSHEELLLRVLISKGDFIDVLKHVGMATLLVFSA